MKGNKGLVFGSLISLLLVLGLLVGWRTGNVPFMNLQVGVPAGEVLQAGPPQFDDAVGIGTVEDSGYLQLINGDYAVTGTPPSDAMTSAWPTVAVNSKDIKLQKVALAAIDDMFVAARHAGAGAFLVSSGYRTYNHQKQLYDQATDKTLVQTPNHSEHQTGLAADIQPVGISTSKMAESAGGQWLANNSWQYGLILRYAADKQSITHIAFEPWHFRYVGQPHAWYCYTHNLSFEEYIQFLKYSGGYEAAYGGTTYWVSYQTGGDGRINLSNGLSYSVSDDNTGGYIVTAWK